MENQKFEYAKGRFINPAKIIEVSIYKKDVPGKEDPSDYTTVYRVALTLDVQVKDKGVVYSDGFETEAAARLFAMTIPMN